MPLLASPPERIGMLRRRGRVLLARLVALRDCGAPPGALCERAMAAVDEYSEILHDSLSRASDSAPGPDAERLRREYVQILGDFAKAACEAIPDREVRHRLAQAIQCAVLRQEHNLRLACQP